MSTGMIEIMKVAAMDAIENSKPCDLRFGTVCSIEPLKIQVASDFIIPESLLIVPQYLTDYTVDTSLGMDSSSSSGNSMEVNVVEDMLVFTTPGGVEEDIEPVEDDESDPTEDTIDTEVAEPTDDRAMTIYNSLEIGDQVALIRNQGGKMYYILDRI